MQPFGLWHWIILGTIVVLNAIPISKILGRVGLSKWWTIAFLIPFVNLIALWIFANARWPALMALLSPKCRCAHQCRKQTLIESYGADIRLPDLREEIAQCEIKRLR